VISMVDCYAISHLFVYIIKYKYTNESLTLNLKGLCTWNGVFCASWKEILKLFFATLRNDCTILSKYGDFKALYLTIETGFYLFDTFPTHTK